MSSMLIVHARIVPRRLNYTNGVYCCTSLLRATTISRCMPRTTQILTLCFDSQVKASPLQSVKSVTYTRVQPDSLRYMSSQPEKKKQSFWQSISQLERVKQTLRDYGVVATVFHISMSLCVLGGMYMLVDNGVNVEGFLERFGFHSTATKGLSTFAAAYILYKFTLPIRATITITCAPLIVRSLRSRGWIAQSIKKTVTKS